MPIEKEVSESFVAPASNDEGDVNENGQNQLVKIGKTTTLQVHHALYISSPSLHLYDVKLPNFTFC